MQEILDGLKHFYCLGFYDYYLIPGIAVGILDAVYTYFRMGAAITHFGKNAKSAKSRALRIVVAALLFSFCVNVWSPAFMVIAFPLLELSVCLDVCAKIVGAIYHKVLHVSAPKGVIAKGFSGAYWTGALLAVIYAVFLILGNLSLTTVVNTQYTYQTDLVDEPLNVLFISDVHYGTIEDPNQLTRIVDDINANGIDYDIAVLGGDIVDERTSNANMYRAFDELGKLHTKQGIYFVYGNHDRQPGETDLPLSGRSFADDELERACAQNNIHILSDSAVDLGQFVLAGREDYGWEGEAGLRAPAKDVLDGEDTSKLTIMVDHQAIFMDEDAEAGADLLLSGHSHGGQMFPFGLIQSYVLGRPVWGEYDYDDLTLFISSGLVGWGWPLRNEGASEYMTIHIEPTSVDSAAQNASSGTPE